MTNPEIRPHRATESAESFWKWAQRGRVDVPRKLEFSVICRSQASADRLSDYLLLRRGYPSTVEKIVVSGMMAATWKLGCRIPPTMISQEWLEDLVDFLETATILCDAGRATISMD
jgi:hypothetical protein